VPIRGRGEALSQQKRPKGRKRGTKVAAIYNFDFSILYWLQENLRNPILDPIMKGISIAGNKGILMILIALIFLIPKKTRRAAFAALVGMAIGAIIVNLTLKPFFMRLRPYAEYSVLKPIVDMSSDPNSFPSGHTTAAFALFGAWLGIMPLKSLKVCSGVLAFLMGFSRLYVGVHFPTDVFVGAAIGFTAGLIGALIVKKGGAAYDRKKAAAAAAAGSSGSGAEAAQDEAQAGPAESHFENEGGGDINPPKEE